MMRKPSVASAGPKTPPPVLAKQREAIYAQRLTLLRSHGYEPVFVDSEGRVVVRVNDSNIDSLEAALYRRVWGLEWPVVRSERWSDQKPASLEHQLLFTSHG